MLQRFLFVGVGGSGGDTLRHLHRDLLRRLRRAGIETLPAGWKFVYIDAPKKPENRAGLDELPPGSYLPLVTHDVDYRIVAQQHQRRGGDFWTECAGWLPPAGDVNVSIQEGAGQFRAIGRALAISQLKALRDGLARAVAGLELTAAGDSLAQVERLMTGRDPSQAPRNPSVVVISSLAGGTGSGVFLDVCDVLRTLDHKWAAESTAVLYAPDVFGALDRDKRQGVQANALASMSELLAGYWRQESGADPLFVEQGLPNNNAATRRGPSGAFLVGMSNGRLSFANQNEVFAAVGRTMGAWATSQTIQQEFLSYVSGNWDAAATGVDPLGLVEGFRAPFSALGYASVDLGRDLFGQYAAQCLARLTAERLLHGAAGAEAAADPAGMRRQEAVERTVEELKRALGFERQQEQPAAGLVAALRPQYGEALPAERQAIATAAGRADQASDVWQRKLGRVVDERREAFRTAQVEQLRTNAAAWVGAVQEQILAEVQRSLQVNGLPITEGAVRALRDELTGTTHTDLIGHAGQHGLKSLTYRNEIGAVFPPEKTGRFHRSRLYPASSEVVQQAINRSLHAGYTRMMDAETCRLAGLLVKDLAERLLQPLHTELEAALKTLRREHNAERGDRSGPIAQWPQSPSFSPPLMLRPGPTQFLVDPIDQFPSVFLAKLAASTGTSAGDAPRNATGKILAAGGGTPLLERVRTWQPLVAREWGAEQDVEQIAAFALHTGADELLARAGAWAGDEERALGHYIRESLSSALGEMRPDAEQQQRLDRFRTCLADAIAVSSPLVVLDGAYAQAHGSGNAPPMITPIPLDPQSPAGRATSHLLIENGGLEETQAASKFDQNGRDEIEFTTFLGRPALPSEFASLTRPIRNDWTEKRSGTTTRRAFGRWRRARPLPDAVPLPTSVRQNLVRGWFVAYLTKRIEVDDGSGISLYDDQVTGDWLAFPMLGERPDAHDPFEQLGAVVESVPLVLIEPLEKNEGAEAYRLLIGLGDPGTTFAPDDNFGPSVRSLLADAQQRYGGRRVTNPTRGWELRADIIWALTELQARYGGRS